MLRREWTVRLAAHGLASSVGEVEQWPVARILECHLCLDLDMLVEPRTEEDED